MKCHGPEDPETLERWSESRANVAALNIVGSSTISLFISGLTNQIRRFRVLWKWQMNENFSDLQLFANRVRHERPFKFSQTCVLHFFDEYYIRTVKLLFELIRESLNDELLTWLRERNVISRKMLEARVRIQRCVLNNFYATFVGRLPRYDSTRSM